MQNIPLTKPHPDHRDFHQRLMHPAPGGRVPLIEYIIDDVLLKPIVTDLLERTWVPYLSDRAAQKSYLDNFIQVWYRLGYDFVRYETGMTFQPNALYAQDVGPEPGRLRKWDEQHRGLISSWEDFEKFTWPTVDQVDFFPLDYLNDHLPEGMGLITCHAAGVFEHVEKIFSYEGLCYALMDQPDLVKAVTDHVGGLLENYYHRLLQMDHVMAIFQGDDMGFRTGTLISPKDLAAYFLPWHQRLARRAHEHHLPYFLHSCGQVTAIMQTLIEEVQIDGKHSFEDAIVPVQEFQRRYGDRIAVLGGVDINILSAGTAAQVREKTRGLINECGRQGRYAIGSGNSIPSYVPVENYLTMIDEALQPL